MAGELVPTSGSEKAIETALARTRKNALGQLALGAVFVTMFLFWQSGAVFTGVLVGLNLLAAFFFGRRAWRLRKTGPVARALLAAPGDITSIHQWPPKLPANDKAFPIGLDIHTRSGHQGMLLLDPKDRPSSHRLLDTLKQRSPEAAIVFTPAPPKLIVP